MAIMIPSIARNFDAASQEDVMFKALESLPNDYYVFHSLRVSDVIDDKYVENEIDFVVINRKLGILCIEAKAGHIYYKEGTWYYQNGIEMAHGGPFMQARNAKYRLYNHLQNQKLIRIREKCKIHHAVWLPSVKDNELDKMDFPPEADKELILTRETLFEPQKYIEKIFEIQLTFSGKNVITNLSDDFFHKLVFQILCPEFNVFPPKNFDIDLQNAVFNRMIEEQKVILDFLEEQYIAVINGAAGTGKTMIALEKARRHADKKEKVLFLCYNNNLKTFLVENYSQENIDFFTLAGLACKLCNTSKPNYEKLNDLLEEMYIENKFPYKHVIVDEGQDFGLEDIDDSNILKTIYDIVKDDEENQRTFYVFYDRMQLIQGERMPEYIANADCKLTLYKNCRNTKNIAVTSLKPISERSPKMKPGSILGTPAKIHYSDSEENLIKRLDYIIETLKEKYQNIVILSCKSKEKSIISSYINDKDKYKKKIKFSTCRRFKGLEADAVILIDVDRDTFFRDNILLYYVGTSRARLKLDILAQLTDDECEDILLNELNYESKIRNPKKDLARNLNALPSSADVIEKV